MKEHAIFIGIMAIALLILINIFSVSHTLEIEINKKNMPRLLWLSLLVSVVLLLIVIFFNVFSFVILPMAGIILIGALIYKLFFQKKL